MESIQNDKIINEHTELICLIAKCILKIENPLDMVNCLLQDLNQFLGQIQSIDSIQAAVPHDQAASNATKLQQLVPFVLVFAILTHIFENKHFTSNILEKLHSA